MRRALRWSALCLLLLGLQCSKESLAPQGEGELSLRLAGGSSPADSVLLWVTDRTDHTLVGPIRSALPGSGTLDVTVTVPSGPDRAVVVQLTGDDAASPEAGARGVLAMGEARGIDVEPGRVVDADLRLRRTLPELLAVEPMPGDLNYLLRWRRVPGARAYTLLREIGASREFFLTTDTSQVESADGETAFDRIYRVRAELSRGTTVYSDSVRVATAEFRDLPRVLSVLPAEGATAVPDTAQLELRFDRPMDWGTVHSGTVVLRSSTDTPVPFLVVPRAANVVRLRPTERLARGLEHRLEVSTEVRDLDGRPLDQAPETAGLQPFRATFTVEAYDPLRVTSISPAPEATEVPVRPRLLVDFNRAVLASSVGAASVQLLDSLDAVVAATLAVTEQGLRVEVAPTSDLLFSGRYRLRVGEGVRDLLRQEPLDQNAATPEPEPFESAFRVLTQPLGPSVAQVTPADGAAAAPVDDPIFVRFSLPVLPATVNGSTFNVRRLPSGANLPGRIAGSLDGLEFSFTPSNPLERDVRYRVVLSTGVTDAEGHPLDQDRGTPGLQPFESTFRAERNPQVVSVEPAPNALRVPLETEVKVRFSLAIVPETLDETSLRLERGGLSVPVTRSLSSDSLVATLRPKAALQNFIAYDVRATSGLRTRRGSPLDQDFAAAGHQSFASRFTTLPESLPPRVVEAIPAADEDSVSLRPIIELRFNRPVQRGSINAANLILKSLPSGSEIDVTRTLTADSLVARVVPASDLMPSSRYEVRVTTWVVDRYDTRFDQDPSTPGRQEFQSRFTTDREHVPPRVSSIVPSDGAKQVDWNATIRCSFTEEMDPARFDPAAVRVSAGGVDLAGQAALSNDHRTVTWTPDEPFRSSRFHDVIVDTLLFDLAGNRFDQSPGTPVADPFRSRFVTRADDLGPSVVASDPDDGAVGVPVTAVCRLTFSEALLPASVQSAAVSLRDSTGASVPFTLALSPGAEQVTLTPNDTLAFSTRYELRATPALTDTAGNAFDQDPAQFGAQEFTADFRTHAETIGPKVAAVRFAAGPPVPLDAPIYLAFSEAIAPASFVDSTIVLTRGGLPVPIARELVAPDSARLTPLSPLAPDAEFLLRVAGLLDLRGNRFDQRAVTPEPDPYEIAFASAPDLVAPAVLSVLPDSGATRVDPGAAIRWTFSEALDPSTATSAGFEITHEGQPIAGVFSLDLGDERVTFAAAAPFPEGASIDLRVNGAVTDVNGNPLDQHPETPEPDPFVSEFTTGFYPLIDAGPGVCDPVDSSRVVLTVASASDPDPDGGLADITWDWGDGVVETLSLPGGLTASHVYACLDRRACDGLDNDHDGNTDEGGPSGCDESYHVRVTVADEDGLTRTDSTGVSFCALQVLGVTPMDAEAGVDTLAVQVRVTFSRAVDAATVDPTTFVLQAEGGAVVPATVSLDGDDFHALLNPLASLSPDTVYLVRVGGGITSSNGRRFDSDLCQPGAQPFESEFRTVARPAPRRR